MKTKAKTIVFTLLVFLAAAAQFAFSGEDRGAHDPAKEVRMPDAPADGELAGILDRFEGGTAAEKEEASEKLVITGEKAVEPLVVLLDSADEALAARAEAVLKKIGVVDALYVKTALFRDDFLPGEPIGVRFIFRNYGAKNVTVFSPARGSHPGFGILLTLSGENIGKEPKKIDMNGAFNPSVLTRDSFAVIKPGETFEEIVTLRELFGMDDVIAGRYLLEGRYSGKTRHNKALIADKKLGVDNLFEGEIQMRPLSFTVSEPDVPTLDEKTRKQIERWIEELGEDEYAVRKKAEKNLEQAGPGAIPILKKALMNPDLQIRQTVGQIIRKITEEKEEMFTFLGVYMAFESEGRGVIVNGIIEGTQAEKYKLQAGDVIVGIDGLEMPGREYETRISFLKKQIICRRKGDIINLVILREDSEVKFQVPLGEMSKSRLEQER